MIPIILISFIIIIWIQYQNTKTNRITHKSKDEFLRQEQESNFTRKKDISSLDYIKIPIDQLPFIDSTDQDLNSLQDDIKNLSEKKILNLNGFTNTWIKQTYGSSNLEDLSSYDENYTRLIKTISNLGTCLYERNYKNEARKFLEFGIQCKTDISNNFILLGNIYKEQLELDNLNHLIDTASNLNTLTKSSILSSLQKIKDS